MKKFSAESRLGSRWPAVRSGFPQGAREDSLDFSAYAEPGMYFKFAGEPGARESWGGSRTGGNSSAKHDPLAAAHGILWGIVFSIPLWALIGLGLLIYFRHR